MYLRLLTWFQAMDGYHNTREGKHRHYLPASNSRNVLKRFPRTIAKRGIIILARRARNVANASVRT